jgi:CHRD domain
MRRLVMSLGAIMLLGLTPLSVSGDDGNQRRTVRANLTAFQEVPALSTTGHGQFVARLGETSLEFELTYADMEDTVVVAHVHFGQRSVSGGIIFFLCGGGGRPACTSPSGSFSGTVTAADVVGPEGQGIAPGEFEEVLRAMRAGKTYVNVHSVPRFPAGEIRGQIRTDNEQNPD